MRTEGSALKYSNRHNNYSYLQSQNSALSAVQSSHHIAPWPICRYAQSLLHTQLLAIIWNSKSPALAVTRHAISPKLPHLSNIFSTEPGLKGMCCHWPLPTQTETPCSPKLSSPCFHLHSLPWKLHGNTEVYLSLGGSFPHALIFCPSRGRGLALSCLSARQFYLSITKPSARLQRPQHCINPLSASQPSITLLSITSDPSSAHLSHNARARRWSPPRAPQRVEGTAGQEEIRGKCKNTRQGRGEKIIPRSSLPSASRSWHPAESFLFMSLHAY